MRAGQESAEAIVASESVAAIGHTRPTPPLSEMLARSLENGRPRRHAEGAKQPTAPALRLHPTMAGRGGIKTAAGFNRRMRKTACPVVWEGHGAESP